MIVSFDTRELLEQCLSLERAEQLLGTPVAQVLVGILADVEALDNCGDLIDLFGEDAKIIGNDMISLKVGPSHRARFVAVGAKLTRTADGRVDWRKVHRLKLIEIHGAID